MTQPTPDGPFSLIGFHADGDAFWSTGLATWTGVLDYLGKRSSDLLGHATVGVLVVRGGVDADDCGVLGPYRLAPSRCPTCGCEATP